MPHLGILVLFWTLADNYWPMESDWRFSLMAAIAVVAMSAALMILGWRWVSM